MFRSIFFFLSHFSDIFKEFYVTRAACINVCVSRALCNYQVQHGLKGRHIKIRCL